MLVRWVGGNKCGRWSLVGFKLVCGELLRFAENALRTVEVG